MTKSSFIKTMFVGMAMLFSGSALAFDASSADSNLSLTNSLHNGGTFKIAAVQFLPDMEDSGLGFGGNQTDKDYNTNNCKDYTLDSCPLFGKCSTCPYDVSKYKLNSCEQPYIMGNLNAGVGGISFTKQQSCICPPEVTLTENETCTSYCTKQMTGANGLPSATQICIAKECVPTPQTDTSKCTSVYMTSDGCGGQIEVCAECPRMSAPVNIPANAHISYEICVDALGEHQQPTGWECNDGYKQEGLQCVGVCEEKTCTGYSLTSCPANAVCSSCAEQSTDCTTAPEKYKITSCYPGYILEGNSCVADDTSVCMEETCSGYNLTSCPTNGNCSSCTPTSINCETKAKKYKLDSCKSGYAVDGNSCVSAKSKCESLGYHNMDYWNARKPSDSSSIFWDIEKISHFKKAFSTAFNNILGIKEANAAMNDLITGGLQETTRCPSNCSRPKCDGNCVGCSWCTINANPVVPGGPVVDETDRGDIVTITKYVFKKGDVCPYDSSYFKGSWVKETGISRVP